MSNDIDDRARSLHSDDAASATGSVVGPPPNAFRTTATGRANSTASAETALAVAGGIAWLTLSADSIIQRDAARYRDALFLVPWILTAGTYLAVHRRQRTESGSLARVGIGVLVGSMALMTVGQVHVVVADAAENLAFPIAPALFAVGSTAFGIATVRAGVLRRRAGVMIATSQYLTVALAAALSPWVPLSDYGNYSGAAMHGVMMLMVAEALHRADGGRRIRRRCEREVAL